jgi:hypothetical protein
MANIFGTFQAFSSAHKKEASGGFFKVTIMPHKNGTRFAVFPEPATSHGNGMIRDFIGQSEGTLRAFRKKFPIQFDWMRSTTEAEYGARQLTKK